MIEITEAMLKAARDADTNPHNLLYSDFAAIFTAMLAAAPKQAEPQGVEKWEGPAYEYGVTWGPDGGQDGAA